VVVRSLCVVERCVWLGFTVRGDGLADDWGSAEPPHPMYMYRCCSGCSFLWFASIVGGGGGGEGGGCSRLRGCRLRAH
jgi:hypothetical protein